MQYFFVYCPLCYLRFPITYKSAYTQNKLGVAFFNTTLWTFSLVCYDDADNEFHKKKFNLNLTTI